MCPIVVDCRTGEPVAASRRQNHPSYDTDLPQTKCISPDLKRFPDYQIFFDNLSDLCAIYQDEPEGYFILEHRHNRCQGCAIRRVPKLIRETSNMTELNHEEFVVLLSRHQRQIWWFIKTLLPAASDADDVLQETSLVLWRKWDQFDRDREFLPWACGIARLQVLRFVREHRSERLHLNELVLAEIAEFAEKKLLSMARVETRLEMLNACVQELDENLRNVIEDRYLRSLATKSIAKNSGKPLVTIYKTLARARVQLMNCVNRKIAAAEAS